MQVVTEVSQLNTILKETLEPSEIVDHVECIKGLIEARHMFITDDAAFVAIRLKGEVKNTFHRYTFRKYCGDLKSDKKFITGRLESQPKDKSTFIKNIKKEEVMEDHDILEFVQKGGSFVDVTA